VDRDGTFWNGGGVPKLAWSTENGASEAPRSPVTSPVLGRLSFGTGRHAGLILRKWAWEDLNFRPHAYQDCEWGTLFGGFRLPKPFRRRTSPGSVRFPPSFAASRRTNGAHGLRAGLVSQGCRSVALVLPSHARGPRRHIRLADIFMSTERGSEQALPGPA